MKISILILQIMIAFILLTGCKKPSGEKRARPAPTPSPRAQDQLFSSFVLTDSTAVRNQEVGTDPVSNTEEVFSADQ